MAVVDAAVDDRFHPADALPRATVVPLTVMALSAAATEFSAFPDCGSRICSSTKSCDGVNPNVTWMPLLPMVQICALASADTNASPEVVIVGVVVGVVMGVVVDVLAGDEGAGSDGVVLHQGVSTTKIRGVARPWRWRLSHPIQNATFGRISRMNARH